MGECSASVAITADDVVDSLREWTTLGSGCATPPVVEWRSHSTNSPGPVVAETTTEHSLADRLLDTVDAIIHQAEEGNQPLEIDPFRARLFELFVTAEAAGYTAEDSDPDLSADGLCARLAGRWGLQTAAQQSLADQTRLSAEQLQKMRSLWSVMRMWMEWSYAWSRWEEFHRESRDRDAAADP